MGKILVADDDAGIRELIRLSLEQEGHDIVEVGTGSEVLSALKGDPSVQLLILDVMLPGMDGYTLQLEMAQDRRMRTLPVIVLTALQPVKNLFDKFPQVKAFMVKPFKPAALAKAVAEALAGS